MKKKLDLVHLDPWGLSVLHFTLQLWWFMSFLINNFPFQSVFQIPIHLIIKCTILTNIILVFNINEALINVVKVLRSTHRYVIWSIPSGKASGMLNRFPLTFISQTTPFWNAGISFYRDFLFCSGCAVDPPWISFPPLFFCFLRHCINVLFSTQCISASMD